ncbi:MAG TPA: hypothetical protein VM848_08100 [Acidimicrobiia bacterium]|nr:hypothetical protein [Acidimicrobiia bacterium]
MEAVSIVLSIDRNRVEEFEQGFRQHELPIWEDYSAGGHAPCLPDDDGHLHPASEWAVQYSISVAFATGEGHHLHDADPKVWNEIADAFRVAPRS